MTRTVKDHENAYWGHNRVTGPMAHPAARDAYVRSLPGVSLEPPQRKPIWGWAIVMGTMFWLCVLAVAVL